MGVTDPIAAGLVESLARPGGNSTGITNMAAVLTGKRLEMLKEALPRVTRVAVLWDPQGPRLDSAMGGKPGAAREAAAAAVFDGGEQRRQI